MFNNMILKKYRGLILAIALFIVIDVLLLVVSFFISQQIKHNTNVISQAGNLQMMSQGILKSMYELRYSIDNDDASVRVFNELKIRYQGIDETLLALNEGGSVRMLSGDFVDLNKLDDVDGLLYVNNMISVWTPFKNIFNSVVNLPEPVSDAWFMQHLEQATRYANSNNVTLLNNAFKLSAYIEQESNNKVFTLRIVQFIGILLAVINLLLIIFVFIKNMSQADKQVDEEREQNSRIMNFVGEGLFLLEKDYSIGLGYSKFTEIIFGKKNLNKHNFIDLFVEKVSDEEIQLIENYLQVLFDSKINENLMDDLNPLREVRLAISEDGGKFINKYVQFNFRRTWHEEKITSILVTAQDITAYKKLKEENRLLQNNSGDQLSILGKILELEPEIFYSFIHESLRRLNRVNQILQQRARRAEQFQVQIEHILCELHKLKGESSMMNMTRTVNEVHDMEGRLKDLQVKKVLSGDDFIPLTVGLNGLLQEFESLEKIANQLKTLMKKSNSNNQHGEVVSKAALSNLIDGIARNNNKKVNLTLQQHGCQNISSEMARSVKDIIIQLTRNSVTHGIESINERGDKHKEGILKVIIVADTKELTVSVHDDGRGIPLQKIREKMVKTGLHTQSQVDVMRPHEIIKMIFEPGFSTANIVDSDAGRGVGMSIIKHMVHRLNGKISINNEEGSYCRFTLRFPLEMAVEHIKPAINAA